MISENRFLFPTKPDKGTLDIMRRLYKLLYFLFFLQLKSQRVFAFSKEKTFFSFSLVIQPVKPKPCFKMESSPIFRFDSSV